MFWTRQVEAVLKEFENTGEYSVKKKYIEEKNGSISEYYLQVYDWFTKQSKNYLEISEELRYPIWLSLEEEYMLQPTEGAIILELEIPETEYLIINNEAWGYRMNYLYIPLNDKDEKAHNQELIKLGIADESSLVLTDRGNFYPLLKKKIIDSWERIYTTTSLNPKEMVAVTWKLKASWIRRVVKYEK
ncbi:MAG TPA: DUF3841 domain-containing protein [Candidatus Dorea intestinavium]|nr:DUF3841 domain-containing protein [Candidatus Dorea intestinavium]